MQPQIQAYQDQHRVLTELEPANDWLVNFRQENIDQFSQQGFPSLRDENWRYTSLKKLLKSRFSLAKAENNGLIEVFLADSQIPQLNSLRIVVMNGQYRSDLSTDALPVGLQVKSLASVLSDNPEYAAGYLNQLFPDDRHAFMSMNSAFMTDGVWLEVDESAVIDSVVEIVFISSAQDYAMIQPRNIYIAGANSRIKIIERYLSVNKHASLTNVVTEVHCSEQAQLELCKIQQESPASTHISGCFARQQSSSKFTVSTITLGATLTRNDVRCQISGSHADCNLFGLYAANSNQHIDNFTQVEHQVAQCTSNELYKGVLDDRSRAVFHGRIYVAQDAQQTDAYQNNRTLLLSRNAEVDTKPQLEIYADDVKCSHGATIGQLDSDHLFYLRARGISAAQARRMLTFAFVNEALNYVSIEALRNYLEDQLDQQMQRGAHYGENE